MHYLFLYVCVCVIEIFPNPLSAGQLCAHKGACAVGRRHMLSLKTCLYSSQVVASPLSIPFEHLSS